MTSIYQSLKSFRISQLPTSLIKVHVFKPLRKETLPSKHVANSPPAKKGVSFTNAPKFSALWWKDVAVVGTVFSITGSCSLTIVQPTLNYFGIQGSFKEGPWTYRAAHLTFSPPSWCAMLVTIGTIFGKRAYFSHVAKKVLSRFLPSNRLIQLVRTTGKQALPKLIKS